MKKRIKTVSRSIGCDMRDIVKAYEIHKGNKNNNMSKLSNAQSASQKEARCGQNLRILGMTL
jgi:hypothetical protein